MRLLLRDLVERLRLRERERERERESERGDRDLEIERRVVGRYRCPTGSSLGEILLLRLPSGDLDLGRTPDARGGERDRLAHELLVEYRRSRPRSVRSLLAHAAGRRVSRIGGAR